VKNWIYEFMTNDLDAGKLAFALYLLGERGLVMLRRSGYCLGIKGEFRVVFDDCFLLTQSNLYDTYIAIRNWICNIC